ncbi:uncharacterized protein DNG_07321 [Cephalotrichum gorgonifer]|uniref:Uncharacterized protein n=1 Tax=Cephalotrichum gorgonifer TaxID=2041049 RepID=A0AAE8SXA5_9PEZI|nr:uncharacterized protein DNG_07321 [Cephalotrichum gorgonifer]
MAGRFDENLPEVVPDSGPEAIPRHAQAQYANQLNDQNPKYPVLYDQSPKVPVDESATLPATKEEAILPAKLDDSPTSATPVSPYAAVTPYAETLAAGGQEPAGSASNLAAPAEERICGLKKRMFWIIVVVAVIVIAAALGGGIGGGLAARNSALKDSPESAQAGAGAGDESSSGSATEPTGVTKTDEASSTSTESDSSSTDKTTTESSTTTSEKPGATETSLLTDEVPTDGFAFQAWSKKNYEGEHSPIYRKEGLVSLGFDAISYIWIPNSKDCCVTFCDDNSVRCKEWYRAESSGAFPQVYISCDGSQTAHACK